MIVLVLYRCSVPVSENAILVISGFILTVSAE